MLLFRIVFLVLFALSYVESAALPLESGVPAISSMQQARIVRMAGVAKARPYGEILDRMRAEGELLIDVEGAGEINECKSAIVHAFWANYCDVKLNQEPLPNTGNRRLFANLLALIRDPKAPITEQLTIDDVGEMFETASTKFKISCILLFVDCYAERLDNLWKGDAVASDLSLDVKSCMGWFLKILLSKDAQTSLGQAILVGRLVQVADFFNDLATSNDQNKRTKAKDILEECAIANGSECYDRTIAGLDDMELEMALFSTHTLEHAIHFLVRQYKKCSIQECLVEHEYAESVEEYVYLLLLLNDHFNLGVPSKRMWSAQCGARKPFDKAARLLMNNLSIEGVCHFIAKHSAFRSFLRTKTEHEAALKAAACDPDLAEDAVYAYVRSIVEPYIYATFAVEGEKFQELTPADIAEMNAF